MMNMTRLEKMEYINLLCQRLNNAVHNKATNHRDAYQRLHCTEADIRSISKELRKVLSDL